MTEFAHPDFGIRDGESAIALPPTFDAGVYFIGRIHTPWTERKACPKNGTESTALCTLDIDARYAAGLKDIETCTHVWLLYFMDRAPRHIVVQKPNRYGEARGVFALRSPARPNPIALSAVRLLRWEPIAGASYGAVGARIIVHGLDCLDGTPLLDIKPYFASTDARPHADVGWHTRDMKKARNPVE